MNPTNPQQSPVPSSSLAALPLPASSIISLHAEIPTPSTSSAPDHHHEEVSDEESSNEFNKLNSPVRSSRSREINLAAANPQDLDDAQVRLALVSLAQQFREHQEEFEEYKATHPAPRPNKNSNPNPSNSNSAVAASVPVAPQQNSFPAARIEPINNALTGQMKARISPPTVFYGKPYITGSNDPTVDEWLEYVERYMEVTSVSEAARCDFSMFYLGGAALSLMQAQRMQKVVPGTTEEVGFWTWRWFKEKLKKQYQPFNKSQVIRDQLNRLRQGNDSLNGYLQAFIQLSAQIGTYSQLNVDGLTDNEKLAYFRRGLNASSGLEIDKADGIMTYERATGLAAKIESAINTMTSSKGPAFSNTLGKTPVTNTSKGKFTSNSSAQPGYGSGSSSSSVGPTAQAVTKLNELSIGAEREGESNDNEEGEVVPVSLNAVFKKLSQEERTKLMKEGRCFFCREVGHITKNCPKKSKIYPKSGNQGKGEARHQ